MADVMARVPEALLLITRAAAVLRGGGHGWGRGGGRDARGARGHARGTRRHRVRVRIRASTPPRTFRWFWRTERTSA